MNMTDHDFYRLTQFVKQQYGINLEKKRQLVVSRLSYPLQTRGYTQFGPFVDDLLTRKDPADIDLVIDKLTTNYTYFMREEDHFTYFRDIILPDIMRRHERDKVLSIWSAGCATGEEAYTISMCIMDCLGGDANARGWDTRVLATDLSKRALEMAEAGVYDLADRIPDAWKHHYFVYDPITGRHKVTPAIRKNVVFREFNLMDPIRFHTKFDVIFCRNVMIYFDTAAKDALVQRFYQANTTGGYLLIGHSETLSRNTGYCYLTPSTFRKMDHLEYYEQKDKMH